MHIRTKAIMPLRSIQRGVSVKSLACNCSSPAAMKAVAAVVQEQTVQVGMVALEIQTATLAVVAVVQQTI